MHGFLGHMSQIPCLVTGHHEGDLTKPMHGDRSVGMGSSRDKKFKKN